MYLKENKWTSVPKKTKFIDSNHELENYSESFESK